MGRADPVKIGFIILVFGIILVQFKFESWNNVVDATFLPTSVCMQGLVNIGYENVTFTHDVFT